MKGIVCKVCEYIAINDNVPENCPVCNAPSSSFEKKDDAIKTVESEGAKEKHIPVITVVKTCGLIPDGCQDVHVKVGEVTHPMLPEHFIGIIDFYLDKEFLARVHLTPEKCNPAAALHLKAESGKLSAIEHCNLHGAWIKEVDL